MNPTLIRTIGRWSLAALVMNAVIGSSVFGLPSVIGGRLGNASPWAWLGAAAGIGIVVACFAEVASRFGDAGGPYLYARVAFGRLAGIEMGWMAYLVRLTGASTGANLFVIYLGEFWPGAQDPMTARLVLAALIAPLAVVNYRGVRQGAGVSNLFIALKLVPLTGFLLLGLALVVPHPVIPTAHPVAGVSDWADVILMLVFAYGGFEAALFPLGEARDPTRDAPFALFLTLAICAVLYSLVQVVVIAALPDPGATERPLAAAAQVFMGPMGAGLMAVAAMISVYGYLAAAMVNAPRLTFAMAENGDLPDALARVHPRFHTPHLSVAIFAVLVWALAASSGFLANLTLSAVSRLFTYGLVCAALPRLRAAEATPGSGVPPAAMRLRAGFLWAALGVSFSLGLATRMTVKEFRILVITLALGLVSWLWVRRRETATQPVTGS